jgi:hypothetical protein
MAHHYGFIQEEWDYVEMAMKAGVRQDAMKMTLLIARVSGKPVLDVQNAVTTLNFGFDRMFSDVWRKLYNMTPQESLDKAISGAFEREKEENND